MKTETVTRRKLFHGLQQRESPEEVAAKVIKLLAIPPSDQRVFPRRRDRWYGSSMSTTWQRPKGLDKQLASLSALLGVEAPDGHDPAAIRAYLRDVARPSIGMSPGAASFKSDRLNRAQRADLARNLTTVPLTLATMSRRRYDKLFRLIARVEERVRALDDQIELTDLAQFAKVGYGAEVPWAMFSRSDTSAAFVAYYVANLGRRSLFTVGKQARALDDASAYLLTLCEADPTTSWPAIARVFPRWDVLMRCSLDERAGLLEMSLKKMRRVGLRLAACVTPTIDLKNMVVRRGDDSSTWNALAGAWNKARDMWMAAAWSVDPSIAEAFVPGKVMRLMAADVAAWHRSARGGLDPDTRVWGDLPLPWEVLSGEKSCTRERVLAACTLARVDPDKSGWAKPRPRSAIDVVRETPETVHGVVVSHPQLASILRKAGWFSGYERRVREVAPAIAEAGLAELEAHWTAETSR